MGLLESQTVYIEDTGIAHAKGPLRTSKVSLETIYRVVSNNQSGKPLPTNKISVATKKPNPLRLATTKKAALIAVTVEVST